MPMLSRFVRLPSTRFQGSKGKIINWIWQNICSLRFETVLDAFGGTGVLAFWAKLHGKGVVYNDVFRWNYYIGMALIENSDIRLTDSDIDFVLTKHPHVEYGDFIQKTFKDIYYLDEENAWLDMAIANIRELEDIYKKAIALSALFQSCLIKRPYNLFHRANLYMRLADVKRRFGNKITWDRPFPYYFRKFVREYNECVFSNGRVCKAMNYDVFDIPDEEEYDLVYIDPPYYSAIRGPTDYYLYYHFLEGLCIYLEEGPDAWAKLIDYGRKPRPLRHGTELEKKISPWMKEHTICKAFERVFEKFQDSILVVSYNSEGIPSEEEIIQMLESYKSKVIVKRLRYQYALRPAKAEELLFIAYS